MRIVSVHRHRHQYIGIYDDDVGGLKLYGHLHGCHEGILINAAGMDDVL